MVVPYSGSWEGNIVSGNNLDKTTIGSGTSNPATWDTGRLFFRTDEGKLYRNSGTEGTPVWTVMGATAEYQALDTAQTFTPSEQTGYMTITIDTSGGFSNGNIVLNIDGSAVETIASAQFYQGIHNPSTSVSIVANADDLSSTTYNDLQTSLFTGYSGNIYDVNSNNGSRFSISSGSLNKVVRYDASSSYDISTCSLIHGMSNTHSGLRGHCWNYGETGTYAARRLYTVNSSNEVKEWLCNSAYNANGESLQTTKSFSAETASGASIDISSDGTKLYVGGYQYTMSTPYRISTATYDSKSFAVGANRRIRWSHDGTFFLTIQGYDRNIQQWNCTTPWDISTRSGTADATYNRSSSNDPTGVDISPTGHKIFRTSISEVYEFDGKFGMTAGTIAKVET